MALLYYPEEIPNNIETFSIDAQIDKKPQTADATCVNGADKVKQPIKTEELAQFFHAHSIPDVKQMANAHQIDALQPRET
jgi:hypothetical protein